MSLFTPFGIANSKPILDPDSGTPALPAVRPGASAPIGAVGMTVADVVAQLIASDPNGDVLGIAVTAVADEGTLYYSLNNGVTWLEASELGDRSALLLAPDARVYVVPPPGEDAGDTVDEAFLFQLWDQTEGISGDTGVNVELGPRITGAYVPGALSAATPRAIVVDNGIAFVAADNRALLIVDASDPAAPTKLAQVSLNAIALDVLVNTVGGVRTAYVATDEGLAAIDVSNPLAPGAPSWLTTDGAVWAIALDDNMLHVSHVEGASNGYQVFDVSQPVPTSGPGQIPNNNTNIHAIAVSGDLLALFNSSENQISVYRLQDGSYAPVWNTYPGYDILDMKFVDGVLYMAADVGVTWVDVNVGATSQKNNLYSKGLGAYQIEVADGKAYLATNTDLVLVVDIATNKIDAEIDVSGASRDLVLAGNMMYVANHQRGVQVVDLVGPTAFSEADRYVSLEIAANAPPVLDAAIDHSLPAALAGATTPSGTAGVLVSELLGGSATDTDSPFIGVAITGVGQGTLYYSIDNGTTWKALSGNVNEKYALLLAHDARVYFAPAQDAIGTLDDAITFKAWDQSSGKNGVTGAYALNGPGPIFSAYASSGKEVSTVALAASDGTLYTVENSWESSDIGLTVYDLSSPQSPLQITRLPLTGFVMDVVVDGDYVYVGTGDALQIYDIRNPAAPALAGSVVTWAAEIIVRGGYAYVAAGNGDVNIVDVSNPNAAAIVGFVDVGQSPSAIEVAGDHAYAINYGLLTVIDITNVTSPTSVGTLNLNGAADIAIYNDYAYIATEDGIQIVDIRVPAVPVEAEFVSTPDNARSVKIDGDRLYVGVDEAVFVYDLVNSPTEPHLVRSIPASDDVQNIVVIDGVIYVAAGDAGLQVLDRKGGSAFSEAEDTAAVTVATPSVPTTPVDPTPTVPSDTIDGVLVQIGTGPDGQQQVTVPVVTDVRNEDTNTANSKLADIAIVKTAAGTALLNVGVPVGTGLSASGPATPVSGSTAQSVLDARIGASTSSTELKAAGLSFLNGLPSGTQMVIQTITLSAQASTGGPLVISAANTSDGHQTALVIDTRALPADTLIDLENIDFAIIVGNARVTGGAGANVVYGDAENQFIVLGEGDDILHGGGGNDTVGSLRGNDQTFGDGGDDVVYGGTGNDVLHGGAGNDRLNGGFGLDRAVQSGVLADYTVTVDGHTVVLTHNTNGEVDRFLDVEAITFDSGNALVVAHEAGDAAVLTAQFADAQLIELNLDRVVGGTVARDDITPELGIALNIDLGEGVDIVRLAGGRADVHIDVEVGQRAELTRLADGAMLAFNNVELLAFANGDVTVLAHNHPEAVIGRAYELLLGRNVDTDGYAFWVAGIENGASLLDTLTAMMQSPEYTGAVLSNSAFVELLYTNGFDRTADAGGKAFWVAALDGGVSRAQVVESVASAAEAVTVIGSTIDVTLVS